ncbi:MAG: hypothetical protein HY562_06425, partial [Ignavibacteriales bacterium]|nr:hypothetical protein [Ignavibacteriales bacterium]
LQLVLPIESQSQGTVVRGVVMDTTTREPIPFANIQIIGTNHCYSGDDSSRARKSKMKQIEEGHFQVVLSTGQFFGERADVRGIACLILAFPFSFECKLAQYIGSLRDTGDQRLIIDYRDRNIPSLRGNSNNENGITRSCVPRQVQRILLK